MSPILPSMFPACAQQDAILFLLGIRRLHDRQQVVGIELRQLGMQPFQRGPAAEIDDFTSRPVESRAMVLDIVDI